MSVANISSGILGLMPFFLQPHELTAWGDSYASGVGAGNYMDGRRCLRYDGAYPVQMTKDAGPDRLLNLKFNNAVCSGAKTDEVEKYQFYTEDQGYGQPNWQFYPRKSSGKPTFGTVTVGGDDVDFPGILNNCIVEGFPWPLSKGFTPRSCDDQKAFSWGLISQDGNHDVPNNELVGKIDSVLKKIVKYGKDASGDSFRLYATGYGQFFNDQDHGCDDTTFARSASPNDGKTHVKLTTELRAEFNQMGRTVNEAIKKAVAQNSADKVKYVDIDALLTGHRFCEPGVKEPDQNNPNLWFYHYPYDPKADAEDAGVQYLNTVAENNVNALSWDPKTTLWVDYVNDFWSKVDENELMKSIGASNEDAAVWNFWTNVVGRQAKLFHPQPAYHQAIFKAILDQYRADLDSNSKPAPTKPDYATGTCHLHVNEWEIACLDDSKNLRAEVTIWDNDGKEIGHTDGKDPQDFPHIDAGNYLRMESKLPAILEVTGEHQGDYVRFTLLNSPTQLSWTSRTLQKDSPDAYCGNGGWDPRRGASCTYLPRGGMFRRDAKNQMDCWFKC